MLEYHKNCAEKLGLKAIEKKAVEEVPEIKRKSIEIKSIEIEQNVSESLAPPS